jgi:hypothetical protein
VKKEALESGIEEALRDKEAVVAENAAQHALCLQHEAAVRVGSGWRAWFLGVCLGCRAPR